MCVKQHTIYIMLKGIKLRIYPNQDQIIYISRLLGSCRFVYNNVLAYKIEKYGADKTSVSLYDTCNYLVALKKNENLSWLKESHSKVLQQTLFNLDNAYSNFFRNSKGFPKFKSRKDNHQSCRFPKDAIGKIKGNRINIIRPLKDVHFKCSIRDEKYLNKYFEQIKSGTLTKTKSGKYYFNILIDSSEYINKNIIKNSESVKDKLIGIDLGIKDFIITSENERFENIKSIRNNENKLKRLQRELSRKQLLKTGEFKFNKKYNKDVEIKRPSKNREKARIKLAKFHEKLANKKENYLHNVVNKLLSENQTIVIENLNVSGMMKNHKLAKSIQELSLFRFKEILKYKAEWHDKEVIMIDRWFPSSKLCSCCGFKNVDLVLKDRSWTCPECGEKHDRDLNAAINIKQEGLRLLSIKISSSVPQGVLSHK